MPPAIECRELRKTYDRKVEAVRGLNLEIQSGECFVLLTTHYMDEAERLCDRLAIIDHGQIIAEGTPADLIERLGGHHVVEFAVGSSPENDPSDRWKVLPGVDSVRHEDGIISLSVREPHNTIPALLDMVRTQNLQLLHLSTRQASLEDVFVHLTGRHLREESLDTSSSHLDSKY